MIQRIQSLYLFLVFILTALILFFPITEFYIQGQSFYLHVFSFENAEGIKGLPNPSIIGILTALLCISSLGSIFQFGNRKLQVKVNAVSLLLNFGVLGSIFYISDKVAAIDLVFKQPEYTYGAFFPIASVLFIILANRSIRKDEALVKQSERIR